MNKNFYVYGHFDNGTCWYVGQGCGNRAWAFNQRNKLWHRVFDDKRPEVKIFATDLTQEQSLAMEVELIASYRLRGQALLNMSGGGERGYSRPPGYNLSASHKAAISASKRGRPNGLANRIMSEDHRQRISEARLNSDAVKASGEKIWSSRRANGTASGFKTSKARAVTCIESNQTYRCAKDAAEALGLNAKHIQACCVGRRKSHPRGKLHWRYS